MPQINKNIPKIAWLESYTNGAIYGVPQDYNNPEFKFCVVSDDLRTKYNLPPIKTWADLRTYLYTVAKNEPSIQAYAAPANTTELTDVWNENQGYIWTNRTTYMIWKNNNLQNPKPDDLEYLYCSDNFHKYVQEMKAWMDNGVFSKNVMNNNIPQADAFEQGQSASEFWNGSVFNNGHNMEKNVVGGKAGYYDLSPNFPSWGEPYNNSLFAISSTSKNKERAALTLDLMHFNVKLGNLLRYGEEGKHYTIDSTGEAVETALGTSNYPADNWTWALRNGNLLKSAYPSFYTPEMIDLSKSIEKRVYNPLIYVFAFDTSSISTEWAVIQSVLNEYLPSLSCGIFGDQTEAKYQEFQQKLKDAGVYK
jgi:hypothetical protein